MNLLDKFLDIEIDNSKSIPPEDMEYCKFQEQIFINAYNAYLTAYNSVSQAYEKQRELVGDESNGFIWKYCDIGVRDIEERLIGLKSSFVHRIIGYFNRKYHLNLSTNNKYDKYSSNKDSSVDILTLDEVLNEYIFAQLDGLTFSECAIKQILDKNNITSQEWNGWYKRWNYEVKGKNIKFSYSISNQIPIIYYYDNEETEICTELKHNKVDSIIKYKNGSTLVKFTSSEFALEFAKKYLGYVKMTEEEIEKLKQVG